MYCVRVPSDGQKLLQVAMGILDTHKEVRVAKKLYYCLNSVMIKRGYEPDWAVTTVAWDKATHKCRATRITQYTTDF
jgi:hypothetical protein